MKSFELMLGAFVVVFLSIATLAETEVDNSWKLAQANNEYALNLYKQLKNGSSKNIFLSPLSLSAAMAMLYAGAKGETACELRHVLGYETADLKEQQVHLAFQQFLYDMFENNRFDSCVLNFANSVLMDRKFDILPDYQARMQELYNATIRVFDFQSEKQRVVKEVNDFVKNRTEGKISTLLNELPTNAKLFILNAVYFKGTWKIQFDPKKTNLQTFYNKGKEPKKVQMMHLQSEFSYAEISDSKALELPYKGENINMLVLLPIRRNGLPTLESSLTMDKLANIRRELYTANVKVSLPTFKLAFSGEMSKDMKIMGASRIFSDEADLSGMTHSSNIFVSQIVHKAVVEVNEEGSEAAATSRIGYRRSLGDNGMFIADHPFLFFIIDNRNGMILFSGRVITL